MNSYVPHAGPTSKRNHTRWDGPPRVKDGPSPRSIAAGRIASRFGLTPAVADLLAALAGLAVGEAL